MEHSVSAHTREKIMVSQSTHFQMFGLMRGLSLYRFEFLADEPVYA